MILRKFDSLMVLTDHAARIASVATVDVSGRDENDVSSATCLVGVVLSWYVVWILTSNTLQLFLAIGAEQHFVNFYENSGQGLLVVLLLEVWICF